MFIITGCVVVLVAVLVVDEVLATICTISKRRGLQSNQCRNSSTQPCEGLCNRVVEDKVNLGDLQQPYMQEPEICSLRIYRILARQTSRKILFYSGLVLPWESLFQERKSYQKTSVTCLFFLISFERGLLPQ